MQRTKRIRINLTLPDDVYDFLINDAEQNCRTISEEVTYISREYCKKVSTSSTSSTSSKERRRHIGFDDDNNVDNNDNDIFASTDEDDNASLWE